MKLEGEEGKRKRGQDVRKGDGDDDVVERNMFILQLVFNAHFAYTVIRGRGPAVD